MGEGGSSYEIGRLGSMGWKNFGRRWTKGMTGLANWTIFIDVIGVSSLADCFVIAHSLICNCPLLKDISFNTKYLLVWCD